MQPIGSPTEAPFLSLEEELERLGGAEPIPLVAVSGLRAALRARADKIRQDFEATVAARASIGTKDCALWVCSSGAFDSPDLTQLFPAVTAHAVTE